LYELGLKHLPHHVHEVASEAQVVVRINVWQSEVMPVTVGADGRHLGDQTRDLQPPVLGVVDTARLRIDCRQRGHGGDQHPHRVRVVAVTLQELLCGLMQHGVPLHLGLPRLHLRVRGQLAVQQQPRHLEERAVLRQFLDRIAPVAQDAEVAVDKRDRAAAGGRVLKCRVVGHDSEVLGPGFDLTQVKRPDRSVLDRRLVLLAISFVGDFQTVRHNLLSAYPLGNKGPLSVFKPYLSPLSSLYFSTLQKRTGRPAPHDQGRAGLMARNRIRNGYIAAAMEAISTASPFILPFTVTFLPYRSSGTLAVLAIGTTLSPTTSTGLAPCLMQPVTHLIEASEPSLCLAPHLVSEM